MPGREMHNDMSAGFQARVVRPVLIGRFDIVTDPVIAWTGRGLFAPTGTGDALLDGQIFSPLAPFIEMTPIREDDGIGGPVTITLTGHSLDDPALRQILRDKRQWRGQPAYLWEGLLMADRVTVMANPVRIKTGVITDIRTLRNAETAVVYATVDEDLGKARGNPLRWVDHAGIFAGDTFSTFAVKLANKPQGFTNRDIQSNSASRSHPPTWRPF